MNQVRSGMRKTLSAIVLGTMMSAGAWAEDTIKLIDVSDIQIYPTTSDVQIRLSDTPVSLESELLGTGPGQDKSIIKLSAPKVTPTGFSLGVEVSLDDSDAVELKEQDRLYVEGSFGRVDSFESLAFQSGTGMLPSIFESSSGAGAVSFLSRASSLNVDPVQLSFATSSPGILTPHYAGVSVGYATSDRLFDDPRDRGFEIALTSMVMTQNTNSGSLSFLEAASLGVEERAYNFGLNVGYRGFSLVASFLRGEGEIDSTYESYDLGVEYAFGSWATSLAVGGYFNEAPTMGYANMFDIDRIYSVEIGASYMIRPWIRAQARLQFFDYRTLLGSSLDGYGGTFFLGTSLGF